MTVVALEQTAPVPGRSVDNIAELLGRARMALREGADIAVFPELAASGYVVDRAGVESSAQAVDGPLVNDLMAVAAAHEGLVAAGYCERDGDEYFNSVVLVGADGPLLNYRKLHLFDAEKEAFTPGDHLEVVATPYGVLGICVCYDLRFVETLRLLSLKGAEIVLAPAAWVGGFDADVPAEGLVQQAEAVLVQANLDQVAVVAVSQAGEHPGARTLGGSVAVDARGRLLAGPLSRREADRASAVVDLADVRAAQERSARIRPRADRRTDVYGVYDGKEIW
ncbi:hypothetical protein BHE97_01550 [Aeromicrobium sp. PE09-221]|uniref:nitrilase-related carbon-nitrogen hydrolase n=1 Tax=Aeromicrobium sp. PE09-221 TaxID=1898043 RepID=UPI000B3E8FD4|nr:nitrilase-related carbon-nitrogen hydrolase [Aeromicrobium sp. PE09-221]OUZ12426.1 hypothetical protein BHE97_01550 [Aeromicrobium sp. PE09-221]